MPDVHKIDYAVTEDLSAENHGNPGFPVLSTPSLLGLFEKAAIAALAPRLGEGQGSVGTTAKIEHLAPTPIGRTVTIETTVVEQDGHRVVFGLQAFEASKLIGKCDHERFIVNVARFREKLAR